MKLGKDLLKEMIGNVWVTNKPERIIEFARYCEDIKGLRQITNNSPFLNLCNNKECRNCREINNIVKEEINKYNENIYKK